MGVADELDMERKRQAAHQSEEAAKLQQWQADRATFAEELRKLGLEVADQLGALKIEPEDPLVSGGGISSMHVDRRATARSPGWKLHVYGTLDVYLTVEGEFLALRGALFAPLLHTDRLVPSGPYLGRIGADIMLWTSSRGEHPERFFEVLARAVLDLERWAKAIEG